MKELAEITRSPLTWIMAALAVGTLAAGYGAGPIWFQNLFGFVTPLLAVLALVSAVVVSLERSTRPKHDRIGLRMGVCLTAIFLAIITAAAGWYWTAAIAVVAAFWSGIAWSEAADD